MIVASTFRWKDRPTVIVASAFRRKTAD